MQIRRDFVDAIGNTPLIRLKAASEPTGCEIYGKAEFLYPGGSVKDREARAIIKDAEAEGQLEPGVELPERQQCLGSHRLSLPDSSLASPDGGARSVAAHRRGRSPAGELR